MLLTEPQPPAHIVELLQRLVADAYFAAVGLVGDGDGAPARPSPSEPDFSSPRVSASFSARALDRFRGVSAVSPSASASRTLSPASTIFRAAASGSASVAIALA